MDPLIRKWFERILISFCNGEYKEYDNPKDIIDEQMIQSFKLSANELLACNEMSAKDLITSHQELKEQLKSFKKSLFNYCKEVGFIE